MYTQDGKPIIPPMGRRKNEPTRVEFEQLLARVEALESAKAELINEPEIIPDDIEALKAEAESLGIEVKGNWGIKKIKAAIEEKRGTE